VPVKRQCVMWAWMPLADYTRSTPSSETGSVQTTCSKAGRDHDKHLQGQVYVNRWPQWSRCRGRVTGCLLIAMAPRFLAKRVAKSAASQLRLRWPRQQTLSRVSAQEGSSYAPIAVGAAGTGAAVTTPVQAGTVTVYATVTIQVELAQESAEGERRAGAHFCAGGGAGACVALPRRGDASHKAVSGSITSSVAEASTPSSADCVCLQLMSVEVHR